MTVKQRKHSPKNIKLQKKTGQKNLQHPPVDARNRLKYDKDRNRCKVFAQFTEYIEGIKYFKEDWISGSTNQRWSNAVNHREGVSHKKFVSLLVQYGSFSNYEYIFFEVLKTCCYLFFIPIQTYRERQFTIRKNIASNTISDKA